jgi:hypothetical protein
MMGGDFRLSSHLSIVIGMLSILLMIQLIVIYRISRMHQIIIVDASIGDDAKQALNCPLHGIRNGSQVSRFVNLLSLRVRFYVDLLFTSSIQSVEQDTRQTATKPIVASLFR